MGPKDFDRWRKAANAILKRAAFAYGDWRADARVAGSSMQGFLRRLPDGFEGWNDGITRLLAEYYAGDSVSDVTVGKAVRMGYALATDRWEGVTRTEAETLRGMGFMAPALPRIPAPKSRVEAGYEVAFAFAYEAKGPGSSRRNRATLGTGTASVDVVDPGGTVPLWELPVPGDGPPLRVVAVDGIPFRPVLRPGSWVPATDDDFAEACAGREPWADTPFASRRTWSPPMPNRAGSPTAPREYAFEAPFGRPEDHARRDERRREALAFAGRLVSIDGVVHRSTTEPSLVLSRKGPRCRDLVTLGWQVDELRFDEDQSSLWDTSPEGRADPTMGLELARGGVLPALPPAAWDYAERVAALLAQAVDWNPVRISQGPGRVVASGRPICLGSTGSEADVPDALARLRETLLSRTEERRLGRDGLAARNPAGLKASRLVQALDAMIEEARHGREPSREDAEDAEAVASMAF